MTSVFDENCKEVQSILQASPSGEQEILHHETVYKKPSLKIMKNQLEQKTKLLDAVVQLQKDLRK